MAFDLINYIYDQTLEQHKGLLAESSKADKESYLKHLIATQMYTLMSGFKNNDFPSYQTIVEKNSSILHQTSLSLITKDSDAQAFFSNIKEKIPSLNATVSEVLLAELLQLDQNAHLGQSGLKELLINQNEWIYANVDEWFFKITQQPYVKLTKSNKKNSLDSQNITKEFNKILHQKSEIITEDAHINPIHLEEKTKEISHFYHIINPLIALIILYFLLNEIL